MNRPNDDLERRLRASLGTHARQAPPGAPLAQRILLELDAPVLRPRRGWRTWSAPLLAAAAIVAAALALVGLSNAHLGAPPAPAGTGGISHEPSPVRQPTSRPAPERTTTTAPTATPPPPVRTANTGGVRGFRASDVTFDSQTEGWALGSAKCASGAGRCTEILHTTDGINWLAAPKGEDFNVSDVNGCAEPCVTHLRFANSTVGYAYGPDALFMTTDGGAHWKQQKGLGADALETVDGNVIVVRAEQAGPPPLFRRAAVGSDQWSAFTVPGFPTLPIGATVQLARAAGVTLLAVTDYNTARGSLSHGALFRSGDGGSSWRQLRRPCGVQSIGFYNTIAAATVAAGDASMAVDCAVIPQGQSTGFGSTVSASPGSTRFVAPASGGKVAPASLLASPSDAVQFVVVSGAAYRSDDTGDSWTDVRQLKGVTYIGFESATAGRALGNGGRSVWTTADAGSTWSEVLFPT